MNSAPAYIPDPLFAEILNVLPICTVDIVLFNEDATETLLFRRVNPPLKGEYYTCGGRLRKNEELIDAALRLLKEELNLDARAEALFGGCVINEIWTESVFEGINYHTVNVYYGTILGSASSVVFDSQHDSLRWFSVDDPALHRNVRKRIVALLAELRKSAEPE